MKSGAREQQISIRAFQSHTQREMNFIVKIGKNRLYDLFSSYISHLSNWTKSKQIFLFLFISCD